jgi:hypothetical protein
MNNKIVSSLMVALLGTAGLLSSAPTQALGLGELVTGVSKGAQASGDPDAFIRSAAVAESLMGNALTAMVTSLASKDKAAEYEASMKAASALTDPAEKQAKTEEVQKSAVALLNETTSNEAYQGKINKMSAAQKTQLASAAYNFSLALLQDKALVGQSQGLIASIGANPLNATKLLNVKSSAASLSNQLALGGQLLGKMPAIFKAVDVKAPASADAKPMELKQVAGD